MIAADVIKCLFFARWPCEAVYVCELLCSPNSPTGDKQKFWDKLAIIRLGKKWKEWCKNNKWKRNTWGILTIWVLFLYILSWYPRGRENWAVLYYSSPPRQTMAPRGSPRSSYICTVWPWSRVGVPSDWWNPHNLVLKSQMPSSSNTDKWSLIPQS